MSDTDIFKRRTRQCQEALAREGVTATVLAPSPNLYYVSGFFEEPAERHLLLFIHRDREPVFIAPQMYESQIRDESWIPTIRTWGDDDNPSRLVAEVADELNLDGERVLLDDQMWTYFAQDIRSVLSGASFGLASEVFADLRIIKDDYEIEQLRRAAALSDEVCTRVRNAEMDVVGMTEDAFANEIKSRLNEVGGEGTGFEPIVGAGPNGAKPHHRHSDRRIRAGEPVVLDFGTLVNHYPGDQTRTVVFGGDPPDRFEEVFDVVREALNAGIECVEPGVEAQEVDRAAREVIEQAGYGDAFIHRTGHGIGLEPHEPPYIVEGNERELEEGMVFSIEPGVYFDGEFGVRLENIFVVTDTGCESLNDSPLTWEPL